MRSVLALRMLLLLNEVYCLRYNRSKCNRADAAIRTMPVRHDAAGRLVTYPSCDCGL
jgi:hypothetical protein